MVSWQRWNHPSMSWIFFICSVVIAWFLGLPLLLSRFCQQQPSLSVVPRTCSDGTQGPRFPLPSPDRLCHGQGRECVVALQFTLRSAKDLDVGGEDITGGHGNRGVPCRVYAVVDHIEHAAAEALPEQHRMTQGDIGGGGKDPMWDFTFTLSVDVRATEDALVSFSFMCKDDAGDSSDDRPMCIGNAKVPVADLLGGKGYARSRTSGEIMAAAQVFDAAGKPRGLLFYSFTTTTQQYDEAGGIGTESGVGLDSLQAEQLTLGGGGLTGFVFWLLARAWGGLTGGVLGLFQRIVSLAWGVGSGVWGVALGFWPILWLAVQGILDVVAALWYLVYMLGAIVVMGIWSLLSMIFGGRRS